MKQMSISINHKFITIENLFFTTMILILLVPVWVYHFFPSQDGPVHLANAKILHDLLFNQGSNIFHEFFVLNKVDLSNWLSSLILMLFNIFLPILIVEKVYLSGYIILLPLSVRYALGAVKIESKYLSFMIFPFVYNQLFHLGFYSFIYSLIFFFYLIGFWLRCRGSLNYYKLFGIALLSLLTYLFHIVSFILAFLVIIILCITEVLQYAIIENKIDFRKLLQGVKNNILNTLLAFVPALLFTIAFLYKQGTHKGYKLSLYSKLINIIKLVPLHSFGRNEVVISIWISFLFVSVTFFALEIKARTRNINQFDSLFVAALCSLMIYFIAPDTISGGGVLNPRLALYPFFILILWFGNTNYNDTIKRYIVGASMAFAFLFLAIHSVSYAKANKYIQQYVSSFDHIQKESTLLPLCFKQKMIDSANVKVFLHLNNYVTTQKTVVSFDNYEAKTGYFPIKWKEELNPKNDLSRGIDSRPPYADITTFSKRTKKNIDYVLLWGDGRGLRDNSRTKLTYRQLAEGYNLVYRNQDNELLELYKRNNVP